MTAELEDGRELHASHDSSVPASDIPEQGKRVQQKFLALARSALGDEAAQRVAFETSQLEKYPSIRELMTLVSL
jgi:hypothetical protein